MSFFRCSSKASEMYFRKMSPRTTCLYSAASMEPRRALAAAHSRASKPRVAEVITEVVLFVIRGMARSPV